MTEPRFSEEVVRSIMHSARYFAHEWMGETPIRIHDRSFDRSGTPAWSPDFRRYITSKADPSERNPEERLRTTRAFRLLRRKAVREYEVAYRIVVINGGSCDLDVLRETAQWLNQRAQRGGHDDRYTTDDVLTMLHSALDKVAKWW